jgi:hypothetical protein
MKARSLTTNKFVATMSGRFSCNKLVIECPGVTSCLRHLLRSRVGIPTPDLANLLNQEVNRLDVGGYHPPNPYKPVVLIAR